MFKCFVSFATKHLGTLSGRYRSDQVNAVINSLSLSCGWYLLISVCLQENKQLSVPVYSVQFVTSLSAERKRFLLLNKALRR